MKNLINEIKGLKRIDQLTQKAAICRRLKSKSTAIRRHAFKRLVTLGYYTVNELVDMWVA